MDDVAASEPVALLQAIGALLPFHPERDVTALRGALRELLGAPEAAVLEPPSATTSQVAAADPRRARPAGKRGRSRSKGRRPGLSAAPLAEDWVELRRQVEAKQRTEGLDWAGLAQATGFAETTIKLGIRRKKPPSDPARPAGQDRRQNRPPWTLGDLPDGRGDGAPRSVPGNPDRHRDAASIAAGLMLRIAPQWPARLPARDVRPNPALWIGGPAIQAIVALRRRNGGAVIDEIVAKRLVRELRLATNGRSRWLSGKSRFK